MANGQTTTDPMLVAVQARAQQSQQTNGTQPPAAPSSPSWNPNPEDPVTHIQIGDNQYHIHSDDLPEAQRRNPSLKVISQDPMLAAVKSRKVAQDNSIDDAATRPGAYQQSKGGPIHNANEEAANPFTEGTTSVFGNVLGTQPTGALMKREDETDSQFMARAREAAKHVTPEQIEQETRANNARVLPTMGAAAAAGPVMLAAETGVAELPGAAKGGAAILAKLAAKYPRAATIAGAYGSWLAVHLAHKLGIPLPKILDAIAGE